MQGFRKVDPDRWEFANEGFLKGQKHLLKSIKRRRNVVQSMSQQEGGPCVEIGQYGKEEELERLRRDRDVLMAEIVKLKQQQHSSMERLMVIEERIRSSEKKQQQMTGFVAKAFSNPMFVQQYMNKYARKDDQNRVEIGQKRRLTTSLSIESLQNVGDQSEIELLFSAALDDESSSSGVKDLLSEGGVLTTGDNILETLLGEDEAVENLASDQTENVEVEEFAEDTLSWGEDLQELADQLGFL